MMLLFNLIVRLQPSAMLRTSAMQIWKSIENQLLLDKDVYWNV